MASRECRSHSRINLPLAEYLYGWAPLGTLVNVYKRGAQPLFGITAEASL